MMTRKILLYLLIHPGTPVPRALARRAPLLGRRAPIVGRRDRVALAGIGGGGIEATRAGAWLPRRPRPGGRRLRCRLARDRGSRRRAALLVGGGALSANLVFERATGKLVNVYSGFWPDNEADQVSPVLLRAICHAKCDAVEATTPLS